MLRSFLQTFPVALFSFIFLLFTIHSCIACKISIPHVNFTPESLVPANWTCGENSHPPSAVDLILLNLDAKHNFTVLVAMHNTTSPISLHLPNITGHYQVLAVPSNTSVDADIEGTIVGFSDVLYAKAKVEEPTSTYSASASSQRPAAPSASSPSTIVSKISISVVNATEVDGAITLPETNNPISLRPVSPPPSRTQQVETTTTTAASRSVTEDGGLSTPSITTAKIQIAIVSTSDNAGLLTSSIPEGTTATAQQGSQPTATQTEPPPNAPQSCSNPSSCSNQTRPGPPNGFTRIDSPTNTAVTSAPVLTSAGINQPSEGSTTATGSQDGISNGSGSSNISRPAIAGIAVSVAGVVIALIALLWSFMRRRKSRYAAINNTGEGPYPPSHSEKLYRERTRRYKGSTWKRISPFEFNTRTRASNRLEPIDPSDFDTEVFVVPRDQRVSRTLSNNPGRYSGEMAARSVISDMEVDEISEEDYRTIVVSSGVTLAPGTVPRLNVNLDFLRPSLSDVRSSTRSNFGTDYKDEGGPSDPESGIDGSFYTHYYGYRTPITGSPVVDLGSRSLLVETVDDMNTTPTRSSPSSVRSVAGTAYSERLREQADQRESHWANPDYREPTRYEAPPDYAATIASFPRDYR